MQRRLLCLTILIIGILLIGSCKSSAGLIKEDLFAMDTYITFTAYNKGQAKEAIEAAKKRVQEIEDLMSATSADSELSKINENAGQRPVKVSDDTFYVIKKGIEYGQLTDGAFDISSLPISRLWGIGSENPRLPASEEIATSLKLVDYRSIVLDEQEKTVFLEKEGMMIDLGGIAKGYAGDEAMKVLKDYKLEHAMINLGGDIITLGGKADASPWRIGIQNPRPEEDNKGQDYIGIFEIVTGSIVTSGDYQRYIKDIYEKQGIRYHHIFDPETGYPADNGLISVTIKGPTAVDSDALSTSVFIMGVEEGLKLINSLENVEAMIVTKDKKLYFSQGLEDQVKSIHPDYNN